MAQARRDGQVPDRGFNRLIEIGQMEFFVRAVDVVVGQAESHQDGGNTENLLKGVNHRDRPPGADEDGVCAESFLVGVRGSLHRGMLAVHQRRMDGRHGAYRGVHRRRCDAGNVSAEKLRDTLRILIGHEAEADFGQRARGDDTLHAWASVTANDAVNADVGTNGGALVERVAGLAPPALDLGIAQDFLVGGAGARHELAFFLAPHANVVVEAGDGDAALVVVQSGDDVAEGEHGIVNRAAKRSGVEFVWRPEDLDLSPQAPTLGIADRGAVGGQHARIGDHGGIGAERMFVSGDEGVQVGAADLFFSFEDAFHIHGQGATGLQVGFEGLDVGEELAFVIGGAAAMEIVVPDDGRKRRVPPLVPGFTGKDVVVAVDNEGGAACSVQPRGVDDRVAGGGNDANTVQPYLLQMPGKPTGTTLDVALAFRLRANAGKADEFLKFGDELLAPGASVAQRSRDLHNSWPRDCGAIFKNPA